MFTTCPACNTVTHFAIRVPEAQWIAEHAPETPPGKMPQVRCFKCFAGRLREAVSRVKPLTPASVAAARECTEQEVSGGHDRESGDVCPCGYGGETHISPPHPEEARIYRTDYDESEECPSCGGIDEHYVNFGRYCPLDPTKPGEEP